MALDIRQQSRRLFDELWSKGKLELIEECIDAHYQGRDPLLGTLTRDGLKQAVVSYRTAFPDLKFTVQQLNTDGDVVIVQWRAEGTHRAALGQLAATGKHASVTGITLSEYKKGRIVRDHTEWDALGLFRQLGAQPSMPAPVAQPGLEEREGTGRERGLT
ncbi:MAG: ester cyclase [Myxococcota bacterium]